jgi:hypothetical protein
MRVHKKQPPATETTAKSGKTRAPKTAAPKTAPATTKVLDAATPDKPADAFESRSGPSVNLTPPNFADMSLSDLLSGLMSFAHQAADQPTSHMAPVDVEPTQNLPIQSYLDNIEAKTGLRKEWSNGATVVGAGVSGFDYTSSTSGSSDLGHGARLEGQANGSARLDLRGLQAQGSASGSVGYSSQGSAHGENKYGTADASYQADLKAYGTAQGQALVDSNGLLATGSAEVGVEARAQGNVSFQSVGVTIGGEQLDLRGDATGYVEAAARATGTVTMAATRNPPRMEAEVGGEAFAGVKAGVEGHVGLGEFVTLEGHADGWAGAGAEAHGVIGYNDGKLRLNFSAGAAVGLGGDVGGEVDIDVKKMADAAINEGLSLLTHGTQYAFHPSDSIKSLKNLHIDLGSASASHSSTAAATSIAKEIALDSLKHMLHLSF